MAYQARGRDPLFDSNMQAAIEKRGRELVGFALIGLGVLVAMMIWSYSPDDPSFLSATDAPAQNWLGKVGATVAAPLMMIVGHGIWALAVGLVAWGVRLALHKGQDRAIGRLIFLPIWVALGSVYASSLTPPESWTHSFDLGGLFGETALGMIVNFLPFSVAMNVKVASILTGLGFVAFGLFVTGFVVSELRVIARFLIVGLVVTYAQVLAVLGHVFSGLVRLFGRVNTAYAARAAERKEARLAADAEALAAAVVPEPSLKARAAQVVRADPAFAVGPRPEPALAATNPEPRAGLLGRIPGFMNRPAPMPEPELIEPGAVEGDVIEAPSGERISAKISDAVKARMRQSPGQVIPRVEPSLTRGRGPQPLVLPEEPPVTGTDGPKSFDSPELDVDLVADASWGEPAPIPAATPKRVVQHTPKRPVQPSRQAKAEAQPGLSFEDQASTYEHPPLGLLMNPIEIERHHLSDEALEENARMLENVLDDYGVKGEIVSVRPGPVVTMYELEPAPGLKASRVIGLSDDIARSMSALSARVSTVPGRSVIGIELPNANREKVVLREILSGRDFGDTNMRLPLALGKDIGGDPVVANLAKMPHLLIAGTTGSGKSVAINTMILSLLYKLTPDECRLIMIDPKMLELSVYDGIPHLLSPVVTDPKKAVVALKWVVGEMEERYRKMSKMGVRNIEGYNGRVREALSKGEMFSRTVQTGFDDATGEPIFETEEFAPETIPYIVVVVDEMADLMMVAGKEIEACIQRLAQMARASGIHLIMATQRPSVDVITGTIKANFPTRISFQVTSKVDSRTILGEQGAEQLLGMGDMLYMAGGAKITRVHGPFVSDEEVEEIVNHLKAFGPPEYVGGVVDGPDDDKESDIDLVLGLGGNTDGEDALYDQAVAVVIKDRKCSTSYIQRKLAIGYNKAARLVEQMEDEGLVSPANHVGKREILVPEQQ